MHASIGKAWILPPIETLPIWQPPRPLEVKEEDRFVECTFIIGGCQSKSHWYNTRQQKACNHKVAHVDSRSRYTEGPHLRIKIYLNQKSIALQPKSQQPGIDSTLLLRISSQCAAAQHHHSRLICLLESCTSFQTTGLLKFSPACCCHKNSSKSCSICAWSWTKRLLSYIVQNTDSGLAAGRQIDCDRADHLHTSLNTYQIRLVCSAANCNEAWSATQGAPFHSSSAVSSRHFGCYLILWLNSSWLMNSRISSFLQTTSPLQQLKLGLKIRRSDNVLISLVFLQTMGHSSAGLSGIIVLTYTLPSLKYD